MVSVVLNCQSSRVFPSGCELNGALMLKRKQKRMSEPEQLGGLWRESRASSDLPSHKFSFHPIPHPSHPLPDAPLPLNHCSCNLSAAVTTGCQHIILCCSAGPLRPNTAAPARLPAWCLVTFSILLQKKRKKICVCVDIQPYA